MVFVRYIRDGKILDDFLFCRGLTSRTTANDVFKGSVRFFLQLNVYVDFHLYLYIHNLRRPMANETHF